LWDSFEVSKVMGDLPVGAFPHIFSTSSGEAISQMRIRYRVTRMVQTSLTEFVGGFDVLFFVSFTLLNGKVAAHVFQFKCIFVNTIVKKNCTHL